MTQDHYDTDALRLASASPRGDDDDAPIQETDEQRDLDALCEQWVSWKATRRLYGPAPTMGSVLGQLSGTRTRPLQPGGPDAVSSAELAALHVAYTCQPDALDKRVFDLYYVHRIAPVKRAAAALGISRAHFYRVLAEFRSRLHGASIALLDEQMGQLATIQAGRSSKPDPLSETD